MDSIESDNHSKYNLALCEIYNIFIHGLPIDKNIIGHYIVIEIFDCGISSDSNREINSDSDSDIYYSEEEPEYLTEICELHQEKYRHLQNNLSYTQFISKHSLIRNYKYIIEQPNYIQPQIVECIYLKDDECIAIVKTYWIRIIQRVWRKICNIKKEIFIQYLTFNCYHY